MKQEFSLYLVMYDEQGNPSYPLDEWLGFRKRQRYSPFVEVKVAEMASKSDFRETARILQEWTAVHLSHTTVGTIVRRVGQAQAQFDQEMVQDLEESSELPAGKKQLDYLYTEADGVFVRELTKKKHIEVSHAIFYEGWNKNGKRVSLQNPLVLMTTKGTEAFWKEVQTVAAHAYSLEQTQVVSNSDRGAGYSADKFAQAFSQSSKPLIHQLDAYHIQQAINRAFGYKKNKWVELTETSKDDLIYVILKIFPTCFREHSYCYDSFDAKYETLKYTKPKECSDCPLANEGICQKVYKVKITTDLRRYTAPARVSKAWKNIFKRRTAVERVNAYLKEFFQLNNVRYRTDKRAKIHFDMVTLIYNASKLAANRINVMLIQQQTA